ncbi:MAG: galactosylceramidase, partial [Pirellulaceae bacterium]|nr:galactosylceramidase [Pirellulaceae bacterium]
MDQTDIQGRMTKTIIWSMVNAYYENLPWPDSGPLKASSPWSGNYEIYPALWAIAHTTQFAQPGWRYIDGACGLLRRGGSYVCLRSPEPEGDWSIIAETAEAKYPQTLVFRVSGGLSTKPLHVWRSDRTEQFARINDLPIDDGLATLDLEPGCIYSFTTTRGQRKGLVAPPPKTDFPFPYRDDFEDGRAGGLPKYFSDQGGAFEAAERPGGGRCLRQTVAQCGIDWHYHPNPEPYTMIGSANWRDYEVECEALVEQSGYAAVYGRIATSLQNEYPPRGYWLKAGADGRWELKAFTGTLAAGRCPFAADQWHALKLKFDGPRITASIDGREVVSIEDRT